MCVRAGATCAARGGAVRARARVRGDAQDLLGVVLEHRVLQVEALQVRDRRRLCSPPPHRARLCARTASSARASPQRAPCCSARAYLNGRRQLKRHVAHERQSPRKVAHKRRLIVHRQRLRLVRVRGVRACVRAMRASAPVPARSARAQAYAYGVGNVGDGALVRVRAAFGDVAAAEAPEAPLRAEAQRRRHVRGRRRRRCRRHPGRVRSSDVRFARLNRDLSKWWRRVCVCVCEGEASRGPSGAWSF